MADQTLGAILRGLDSKAAKRRKRDADKRVAAALADLDAHFWRVFDKGRVEAAVAAKMRENRFEGE